MAIIVKNRENGERYVVLGAGFGAYAASHPSMFLGSWAPSREAGHVPMIAVCQSDGEIGFFDPSELEVISVDGKGPQLIINGT
jgi:hypothetical protein